MMAAKWDTEEPTNQKGTTIRTHHLFESHTTERSHTWATTERTVLTTALLN